MIVSSPDNFRKTREHGFSIQGLKSRHRRRVETMRMGDRLLYYVTGRMGFAATVTVASPMYEDHTPIWRSSRRDEDYPWRVHIRADLVLEEPDWVPAKEIAYRLHYVPQWPPEHRTLAFPGPIPPPPRARLPTIEAAIARRPRGRTRRPQSSARRPAPPEARANAGDGRRREGDGPAETGGAKRGSAPSAGSARAHGPQTRRRPRAASERAQLRRGRASARCRNRTDRNFVEARRSRTAQGGLWWHI